MRRFYFSAFATLAMCVGFYSCKPKAKGEQTMSRVTFINGPAQQSRANDSTQAAKNIRCDTGAPIQINVDETGAVIILGGTGDMGLDNYFEFDHTSLQQAMERVARWRNLKCEDDYPEIELTGKVSSKLPCEEIIAGIGKMCNREIRVENDVLKVR